MKRTILFFTLALHLSLNAQDVVQKLHEKGDFIQIANLGIENWKSDGFSVPFLRAKTYNAMGRHEESNKEIEFLLTTDVAKENQGLMFELLWLQAENYTKTFQYKQASDHLKKITDNYSELLGEGILPILNYQKIYTALQNVEPPKVEIPHNAKNQIKLHEKGFQQVQVHNNTSKDTITFSFDTGATMSAATESVAKRLGIKDYRINIGTSETILAEIDCFTQPRFVAQEEYDGILGQDVISQYDYMLLDFKNMYFSLENYK